MRRASRSLLVTTALLGGLFTATASFAQLGGASPVIPYRGVLEESGVPANGVVAMTFRLWTAPTGGTLLATINMPTVAVHDGRFAVDIGPLAPAVLAAGTLHLEILVAGTLLNGRQPIRPTTYSVRGAPASDFFVDGNLGVGTPAPLEKAHVESGQLRVRASHNTASRDIATFLAQNQSQGVGISFDGIEAVGSNASQHLRLRAKGDVGRVLVQSPLTATSGARLENGVTVVGELYTATPAVFDAGIVANGPVFTTCAAGFTAVVNGRLCIETALNPAQRMHQGAAFSEAHLATDGAIATCRQRGPSSRVCTSTDIQQACGAGFDAFASVNSGSLWYGELVGNNLFMYTNGSEATCAKTDAATVPLTASLAPPPSAAATEPAPRLRPSRRVATPWEWPSPSTTTSTCFWPPCPRRCGDAWARSPATSSSRWCSTSAAPPRPAS